MAIHFTKEEFKERQLRVIKELKSQGLDALLMFRQESLDMILLVLFSSNV